MAKSCRSCCISRRTATITGLVLLLTSLAFLLAHVGIYSSSVNTMLKNPPSDIKVAGWPDVSRTALQKRIAAENDAQNVCHAMGHDGNHLYRILRRDERRTDAYLRISFAHANVEPEGWHWSTSIPCHRGTLRQMRAAVLPEAAGGVDAQARPGIMAGGDDHDDDVRGHVQPQGNEDANGNAANQTIRVDSHISDPYHAPIFFCILNVDIYTGMVSPLWFGSSILFSLISMIFFCVACCCAKRAGDETDDDGVDEHKSAGKSAGTFGKESKDNGVGGPMKSERNYGAQGGVRYGVQGVVNSNMNDHINDNHMNGTVNSVNSVNSVNRPSNGHNGHNNHNINIAASGNGIDGSVDNIEQGYGTMKGYGSVGQAVGQFSEVNIGQSCEANFSQTPLAQIGHNAQTQVGPTPQTQVTQAQEGNYCPVQGGVQTRMEQTYVPGYFPPPQQQGQVLV